MKTQIKGLYETHLNVSDLEKSKNFYSNVLGLELCYEEEERKAAFFWIGKPRQSFLGLWQVPKDNLELRHFAFETSKEYILEESIPFFKKHNIDFYNFLNNDKEEAMVFCWIPALAIYFRDPDGHSLEFIAKLDGPADSEGGVVSYEKWNEKL